MSRRATTRTLPAGEQTIINVVVFAYALVVSICVLEGLTQPMYDLALLAINGVLMSTILVNIFDTGVLTTRWGVIRHPWLTFIPYALIFLNVSILLAYLKV